MPKLFSELKVSPKEPIRVQSYNKALANTAFAQKDLNTLAEVESALMQNLSVSITSWTEEVNTLVEEIANKFKLIAMEVSDKPNAPLYKFAVKL